MFRKLVILYLLFQVCSCENIDLNICPNGETKSPSDFRWPKNFPYNFEISVEITTDIETLEITQLFIGPYHDMISFQNYQTTNLQIYYDFQLNEQLIINEELKCDRFEIQSNEYLPFFISQYIKPSILFGFNGRNNYNKLFYTQYLGKEIIRGGILTNKFQSCFYINEQNLTINATYYLIESSEINIPSDIIQIDIQTTNYPYTYNIIRYISNHSMIISTPSDVFCPNRSNTKEFPNNLPSNLFLHAESYTLENNITSAKIDFYSHLIDQTLEFERIDYHIRSLSTSNCLLIDYLTNLNYIYTYETQQCLVMNSSFHSMRSTNKLLFQLDNRNDSIQYHYTGLSECGHEHIQCHRWIGQYDMNYLVEQYEWYWSAKYDEFDLNELIPIKLNIKTILKNEPIEIINQEISIFNYDPWPNSIEAIDSILGQCYRSLGPSHHFNYAILRFTLNNDAKHPIHQYLLSLENQIHIQLANDLQIRHIRLSSFVIDINHQQNQDVYVTFTLLDNPIMRLSNFLHERSSLELIRQLTRQINDENFYVRIDDGGFHLQARPESLRILVLYLLPSENHTNYINETVFVYENVTQTIIAQRQKSVYKHIGPHIVALCTTSTLLSLIATLAVGFFMTIRKWTPTNS